MKDTNATILENRQVARNTFLLVVKTSEDIPAEPGSFASLSLPGFFLRRPLGIVDSHDREVSFLYKIVGEGTKELTHLERGDKIDILLPLGNGTFPVKEESLLVGAGIGIAPLLFLAKRLQKEEKSFSLLFAFETKEDIPLLEEIRYLDPKARFVTRDGSFQTRGYFTDALQEKDFDRTAYCCGPMPFLKQCQKTFRKGYLSLECRMGCGYGICNGCTILTKKNTTKKICTDGLVFPIKEVDLECWTRK